MKAIASIVLLLLMFGCEHKNEILEPKISTAIEQEVEIVIEEQIDAQIEESIPLLVEPQQVKKKPIIIDTPPPLIVEDKKIYSSKPDVQSLTEAPTSIQEVKEETKLRSIKSSIPSKCHMWSDGCNTCTRAEKGKANCTTYKCESNLKFSCLQWN